MTMAEHPAPASAEAARIRRLARDVEPSQCCPDAIADCVAGFGVDRLRYVAPWKRWMLWDGERWRADDTQRAFDLARDIARTMLNAVRRTRSDRVVARVARRLGGAGFVAEVARMAGADRRLAASPGQFDADPDLLNTPDGIVDTRTGAVTPHRPDAYMTRITAAAAAAPGTPCPAWDGLIERLTGGDAELHFFLQRVVGRALARRSAGPAAAADRGHPLVDTIALILGDGAASAAIREGLGLVRLDPVARDPDLADRLMGEYPAILRWAIDGCFAWRRIGLAPPTHARRPAAAEAIARFLGQDAEASPASWVAAGDLYARWRDRAASPKGEPREGFAAGHAERGRREVRPSAATSAMQEEPSPALAFPSPSGLGPSLSPRSADEGQASPPVAADAETRLMSPAAGASWIPARP
jgi:hypothetical protein